LIDVYQYYRSTGDREFLKRVWPASKKAAERAIRQCGPLKLPTKLQSTYEIKLKHQDGAAYNSFIYLAGLSITREMASLNGDREFADRTQGLLDEARGLVDERFWTGKFYRAWWNADGRHPDAIQSDTLYGQLWASLLDLGPLVPPQKMKSQLALGKTTDRHAVRIAGAYRSATVSVPVGRYDLARRFDDLGRTDDLSRR